MNLLGKLFIVLIFIGSIMFASFSIVLFATHTNWRTKHTEVSARLEAAQVTLRNLESEKASMESALKLLVEEQRALNITLSEEVRLITQDYAIANAENVRLTEALAVQVALVETAHEALGRLRVRFDEVTERLRESQNEWTEMSTELVRKIDEAHGLAIRLTNYQTIAANLAEDYRKAIEVLRMFGLRPDPALYPRTPPAGIHGIVTEVRPSGWVEISIGTDSGLARGHQLDVVRNRDGRSVLIGRIEIIDPIADRAVARVMEFPRGIVQRGDEVMYIEVSGLVAVH